MKTSAVLLIATGVACGSTTPTTPTDAGADTFTVDAADGGIDNGAPSDVYPAPHPPMPQLVNKTNGKVLTAPRLHLIFYPKDPMEASVQGLAAKIGATGYWSDATKEYGVAPIAYDGTVELTNMTPPAMITQADLDTWMGAQLKAGTFGTPDPQGIYTIVMPQGTVVTEPNPVSPFLPPLSSCVAFGGYHDDASVTDGDGGISHYAYAVLPTCGGSFQALSESLSHEWVEAVTDPFLSANGAFSLTGGPNAAFFSVDDDHAVWALLGGGEAGDLCIPEGPSTYIVPGDLGSQVQRTWSNQRAAASHDPCAPTPMGAFFDSAPVLPETITFSTPLVGTVVTKGLTIPVGQSKTIEVDLFSDAATNGPWTVTAEDVFYKYYGSYGFPQTLSFAWDRTAGVNGEKLHLTITVTGTSAFGGGHAFMITSQLAGRTAVWPGLVVEK